MISPVLRLATVSVTDEIRGANGIIHHADVLLSPMPLKFPPSLASIDIYCHWVQECRHPKRFQECHTLSSSLNVQLTDALRKYVDERASDKDVYATPSEYIRDLIRQDMQDRAIALNVLEGLDDLKHGRFSAKSIRDFKDPD